MRESNIRLSDRLQEVKLENKAMRQVSADYERVKRAFGPEQVDRILEAAYQQDMPKGTETGRKVKNSDRRTIITKTGGYSSEYPPILFVESVK